MEGPSLFLAAEQLAPFIGKTITKVSGNSKIGIQRLKTKKVLDIFAWGKHLVFQLDSFAVRIHFMLFGSFEATVQGKPVTGDYKKKAREPRLAFVFSNGHIEMYSCSVRYLEDADAKKSYDFSIDIMSPRWDGKGALSRVLDYQKQQIGDVLLDQEIFAGVGNIIKNEVLYLTRVSPLATIDTIPRATLRKIIKQTQAFSHQFYKWRKVFTLGKNLVIYRKGICPNCGGKITRAKTGKRERWSYYCPVCQKS